MTTSHQPSFLYPACQLCQEGDDTPRLIYSIHRVDMIIAPNSRSIITMLLWSSAFKSLQPPTYLLYYCRRQGGYGSAGKQPERLGDAKRHRRELYGSCHIILCRWPQREKWRSLGLCQKQIGIIFRIVGIRDRFRRVSYGRSLLHRCCLSRLRCGMNRCLRGFLPLLLNYFDQQR